MSDSKDKSAKSVPPKKRKRRTRKPKDEPVHYVVQVSDWDCHYGFQISDPKSQFDDGPFSNIATLTFSGDLMEPDNSKYSRAELTLSARNGMGEEKWREPPTAIGSLGAYENTLTAYVFVPIEHMAMLVSLAASGKVQRVWMLGSKLRYRSGRVQNISIDTEPEEEDEEG